MKWQHLRYCRTILSTTKSGRLQKYFNFTYLQKYFCKLFWTSHTERNVKKKMDYLRRKCSQNANIHNSNNSTLHYIATSGATSRSCARGCSSPGSRWTATNVSSNSAAVSNTLKWCSSFELNWIILLATISSRLRQQPGAAEREVQPRPAGPARAAVQRGVQGARAGGEGLHRVIQWVAYTGSSWESGNVKIIINVRNWMRRYIAMYLLMLLHF